MVKNLVAALREDLTTLSWMSDPTRTKAIAKFDAWEELKGVAQDKAAMEYVKLVNRLEQQYR